MEAFTFDSAVRFGVSSRVNLHCRIIHVLQKSLKSTLQVSSVILCVYFLAISWGFYNRPGALLIVDAFRRGDTSTVYMMMLT